MAVGWLVFKNRMFSHLAAWKIIESARRADFYWPQEKAPGYFHFEPDNAGLSVFRNEIGPVIQVTQNEFDTVLKVAEYVMNICNGEGRFLRWDSPEGLLKQAREGRAADCFERAVLFSTYLSSLGFESRLWAFENDKFDGIPHAVAEVYIKDKKKWVFWDLSFGFYTEAHGFPLSVLEFREMFLGGKDPELRLRTIGGLESELRMPVQYRRLIRCVFLRAANDFSARYDKRYGIFSFLDGCLDKLPTGIRRGIVYFMSGDEFFIHYVDGFSKTLKPMIIVSKTLFYFLVVSSVSLSAALAAALLAFFRNLSRKETFHR